MKKQRFPIFPMEQLCQLCIRKKWFSGGTSRQYDKLFDYNSDVMIETVRDIADYFKNLSLIIWLCTADVSREEIESDLRQEYYKTIGKEC